MEHQVLIKDLLSMNKVAMDSAFDAINLLARQGENLSQSLLNQVMDIPETNKKAMMEWIQLFTKGRQEAKKVMDQNFDRYLSSWDESEKVKKTKGK